MTFYAKPMPQTTVGNAQPREPSRVDLEILSAERNDTSAKTAVSTVLFMQSLFLFPQPQHCEYFSLPPFVSFARGISSHATLCNSYNCNYNCKGHLIIRNQYQYQPVSVRQFLCNSCNSKSQAFCLFPLQYAWLFRIYRCFSKLFLDAAQ